MGLKKLLPFLIGPIRISVGTDGISNLAPGIHIGSLVKVMHQTPDNPDLLLFFHVSLSLSLASGFIGVQQRAQDIQFPAHAVETQVLISGIQKLLCVYTPLVLVDTGLHGEFESIYLLNKTGLW